MIFVLLGIALGVAVSLGYIPVAAHAVDAATNAAVSFGQRLATSGVQHLSAHHPTLASALGVTLGVAMPGLVCLALISAAKFGLVIRRSASGLLLLAGIAAHFFLPAGQAFLISAGCVTLAALLFFATGALVVAPLSAVAAALAVGSVRVLLSGKNAAIESGVKTFAQLSHVADPRVWRIALIVVAWAGFVGAAAVALKPRSK